MIKLKTHQAGASLIEVLIAILLLSFGMLALGGMLASSVQLPKLSAYRATATALAAQHIERIRANPNAFATDNYTTSLSYDGNFTNNTTNYPTTPADCTYPSCTEATLATMDTNYTKRAAHRELPAGGMIMKCDTTPCTATSYGQIWIVWQEPSAFAALNASNDNCPAEVTGTYTDPKPRCLFIRFKIS